MRSAQGQAARPRARRGRDVAGPADRAKTKKKRMVSPDNPGRKSSHSPLLSGCFVSQFAQPPVAIEVPSKR